MLGQQEHGVQLEHWRENQETAPFPCSPNTERVCFLFLAPMTIVRTAATRGRHCQAAVLRVLPRQAWWPRARQAGAEGGCFERGDRTRRT